MTISSTSDISDEPNHNSSLQAAAFRAAPRPLASRPDQGGRPTGRLAGGRRCELVTDGYGAFRPHLLTVASAREMFALQRETAEGGPRLSWPV